MGFPYRLSFKLPTGVPDESIPEVDFLPLSGSRVSRSASVEVTITDDSPLASYEVWAEYRSGFQELVYSSALGWGAGFQGTVEETTPPVEYPLAENCSPAVNGGETLYPAAPVGVFPDPNDVGAYDVDLRNNGGDTETVSAYDRNELGRLLITPPVSFYFNAGSAYAKRAGADAYTATILLTRLRPWPTDFSILVRAEDALGNIEPLG